MLQSLRIPREGVQYLESAAASPKFWRVFSEFMDASYEFMGDDVCPVVDLVDFSCDIDISFSLLNAIIAADKKHLNESQNSLFEDNKSPLNQIFQFLPNSCFSDWDETCIAISNFVDFVKNVAIIHYLLVPEAILRGLCVYIACELQKMFRCHDREARMFFACDGIDKIQIGILQFALDMIPIQNLVNLLSSKRICDYHVFQFDQRSDLCTIIPVQKCDSHIKWTPQDVIFIDSYITAYNDIFSIAKFIYRRNPYVILRRIKSITFIFHNIGATKSFLKQLKQIMTVLSTLKTINIIFKNYREKVKVETIDSLAIFSSECCLKMQVDDYLYFSMLVEKYLASIKEKI